MFNIMQIVGALWIGLMLDNKRIASRRTRGFVTVAVVATVDIASWIGLTVWLYRNPMDPLNPPLIDWTGAAFGGFFILNLLFGMLMVVVSICLYIHDHQTILTELSSIR